MGVDIGWFGFIINFISCVGSCSGPLWGCLTSCKIIVIKRVMVIVAR